MSGVIWRWIEAMVVLWGLVEGSSLSPPVRNWTKTPGWN